MKPTPDLSGWRRAVDLAALARWMDERGLGSGSIEDPTLIGGGTQNILLRFSHAGEDYVLRRPPFHKRRESDEVMRREMRILAALSRTAVPHPGLIAGEPYDGTLGAAFYLMRPIDGFNPGAGLPPHAVAPDWQRRLGEAVVDGIVIMAAVSIDEIGLGDLGRRDGWIERQVPRWRKQLDGYHELRGWSGPEALPPIDPICAWLDNHRPASFRPGLIHGDYHLSNVLCRHEAPKLAAIVDWELATTGDPLLDLGWLLATWPTEGHPAVVDVQPWAGFPDAGELRERYLSATGRSAAEAHWYEILACFKLAVLLEGTHARACAGLVPASLGERLHGHSVNLLNRALRAIQPGARRGF